MKYLSALPVTADVDAIARIHQERSTWVSQRKKGFLRYRTPYQQLSNYSARHLNLSGDAAIIGHPDEVSDEQRQEIKYHLQQFIPWRKGPFSIFGIDVDAEWRSERKWNRVLPSLPDLEGKTIADIGCNNGYYMFRMVPHRPKLVLGFEPTVQHYYCFKALNSMAGCSELDIDLLGVEHLPSFRECFDVIFLMGIIYHRPSPIDTLRDILTALKPGGICILESQALPGDDPIALFPTRTYAKVPGTYFVPTGSCLINWMHKAGFGEVDCFDAHPMSSIEQLKTEWMQFESYSDFLDTQNPEKTVEGYPAPWRVFLRGIKKP